MPQWKKTGNMLDAEAKARKAADDAIEKKLPGVATSSTPGLVKASESIKVAGDGTAEVDVDKLGAALAGVGLDYSSNGGLSVNTTELTQISSTEYGIARAGSTIDAWGGKINVQGSVCYREFDTAAYTGTIGLYSITVRKMFALLCDDFDINDPDDNITPVMLDINFYVGTVIPAGTTVKLKFNTTKIRLNRLSTGHGHKTYVSKQSDATCFESISVDAYNSIIVFTTASQLEVSSYTMYIR